MINGKKVLAIVPARGGSKRLPKKNKLPLGGRPLFGWTIDAAKKSHYVDEILLSTDDAEIMELSHNYNLKVSAYRPPELAADRTPMVDVVIHCLEKQAPEYDVVVLLQPTSPFREAQHIDEALELWVSKNAFSIVSVCENDHPVEWINHLPPTYSMSDFMQKKAVARSQDYEKSYRLNGAIYIFDVEALLDVRSFDFRHDTYAYVMPRASSIDIDDATDFAYCKFLVSLD